MIIWYKNSFLASVVSIFGCVFVITAISGCLEGEYAALLLAIPGIALLIWARKISHDKEFKKWWQQIIDNNLQPQIATSVQTALAIYNKNPQERTLKKIAELNPAAAQHIRQSLAAQKKK